MSRFLCTYCLAVSLVFSLEVAGAAADNDGEVMDARDVVLKASEKATTDLQSAVGEGVFKRWQKGELVEETRFSVAFKGNSYRLVLTYPKPRAKQPVYDERRVCSNGNAIYATRFSARIHPIGCETDIVDESESSLAIFAGFPYNLCQLDRRAIYLPMLVRIRDVAIKRVTPDSISGSYAPSAKIHGEFIAKASSGYHITEFKATKERSTHEWENDWKQDGDVWYVKRVTERERVGDVVEHESTCEYTSFTANAPVADDLFTLRALNPLNGSRMLDRRKNALAKVSFYDQ